jgi:hydroxyacyl-ACP dehydratase HTD2-like protein with hotdog domain
MSRSIISEKAKSAIGQSQPPITAEVSRREIQKYSLATQQSQQKYLDGDEAPPMFLFGLLRPLTPISELGPDGIARDASLPDLPLKRVMAGGTEMIWSRPIRPGDVLTATKTLSGMEEKQGKTGPLILLHYELDVLDANGSLVVKERSTRICR